MEEIEIPGEDLQNSVFHRLRLDGHNVTVYISKGRDVNESAYQSGETPNTIVLIDGISVLYNPVISGRLNLEDDRIVITRDITPRDVEFGEPIAEVLFTDIETIQNIHNYFLSSSKAFGVFCKEDRDESCILYNGQNSVRTL